MQWTDKKHYGTKINNTNEETNAQNKYCLSKHHPKIQSSHRTSIPAGAKSRINQFLPSNYLVVLCSAYVFSKIIFYTFPVHISEVKSMTKYMTVVESFSTNTWTFWVALVSPES